MATFPDDALPPEGVYESRESLYAKQQPGKPKTNKEYRKAMKLPARYPKTSYNWCLNYKYMGEACQTGRTSRPWTTEEMMAYLDWSNAEDARVEEVVRKDPELGPQRIRTRGMAYLWDQVDRDMEQQARLYSR